MRSVYGKECAKHPELAGRRYLPNLACIKCHSDQNRERHAARKKALNELIESALEIEMLVGDHLSGEYEIDSFTLQALSGALRAIGK